MIALLFHTLAFVLVNKMLCIIIKGIESNIKILLGYLISLLALWFISIISPYLSGQYIDYLVNKIPLKIFALFILAIAILNVLQIGLRYTQSVLVTKLSYRIIYQVSNDVFQKIFQSEYKYYSNIDNAYMVDQISKDSNAVVTFLTSNVINFFLQSATIVTSAAFVFRADKLLCAIILALIPFYALTFSLNKSKMYKAKMNMKKTSNVYFSRYAEQINKLPYIKRNVLNNEMHYRLEASLDNLVQSSLHSVRVEYLFSNLNQVVIVFAYICILSIGGYKVSTGELSIGFFSVINTYFSMIINSVSYFIGLAGSYQDTKVSFERIEKILNIPDEAIGTQFIDEIRTLEIKDLCLRCGENDILSHCNCNFEQGKLYGIRGHNGAGKTTLLNALMGIFSGEHTGYVFYNDIKLEDLNMADIRRNKISYVEQDPVLLNMSVRDYLQFGIDMNEKILNRQDKLLHLLGIDCLIDKSMNENGSNFSGGEKQKLSLTHALSKESSLILLDEPTSALDKHSIEQLLKILQIYKQHTIIIAVSHDPVLLSQCDEIINICDIQEN